MSRSGGGQDGWAGTARRLAAARHTPAAAGALLAAAAITELALRAAYALSSIGSLGLTHSASQPATQRVAPGVVPQVTHSTFMSPQSAVLLGLLCLATTLPVAFLRPAGAAVAVTAADVLVLGAFQALTGAGAAAALQPCRSARYLLLWLAHSPGLGARGGVVVI